MQHVHLTNSEVAAISNFNATADGYQVSYNGRNRRFVLTATDTNRVIDSRPELWDVLDSGLLAEFDRVERFNPRVRIG